MSMFGAQEAGWTNHLSGQHIILALRLFTERVCRPHPRAFSVGEELTSALPMRMVPIRMHGAQKKVTPSVFQASGTDEGPGWESLLVTRPSPCAHANSWTRSSMFTSKSSLLPSGPRMPFHNTPGLCPHFFQVFAQKSPCRWGVTASYIENCTPFPSPLSCFSVLNMTLTIETKHRVSGLLMTRCESRGGRVSLVLPLLSPWHSDQCLVIVVAKKQTKLYGRQTYKHRCPINRYHGAPDCPFMNLLILSQPSVESLKKKWPLQPGGSAG